MEGEGCQRKEMTGSQTLVCAGVKASDRIWSAQGVCMSAEGGVTGWGCPQKWIGSLQRSR